MVEMMIIFFLFSMPLLFFVFLNRSYSKDLSLPPGPYSWPIIGNLFQIGKNNIHIRLAELAKVHGPLMSFHGGKQILIVGSSSIAALEILKTKDEVLSGRTVSRFLHEVDQPVSRNLSLIFSQKCDDRWRSLRNIYRLELSSSKALETRGEMRENKVMEMVNYLSSKEGEDITITKVLFVTIINILGNTSFSIDLMDYEGNGIGACVMKSIKRIAILGGKPLLADMFPKLGRWGLQRWYKEVMHIIEEDLGGVWKDSLEKKRNENNITSSLKDLIDTLIHKGFTNHQINLLMQEVFSAGIEGTRSTAEWFIVELLKNQEIRKKAFEEITKQIDGNVVKNSDLVRLPFVEACFKETLRLHPPGPLLLPHEALETCQVMGYTIPKGSHILVNVWAINRDPDIWDDPLVFRPERFVGSNLNYKGKDFEYIPFGSGRRMCPGEVFASRTILLIVASLILNFEWFLPNNMNPDKINMEEELDIAMHKKEPLHVIFKVRDQFKI